MTPLVEIEFGSFLYGTSTPLSDRDVKLVFVPTAQEILLQQVQPHLSNRRAKEHGEKNVPTDVDVEAFALHRYLSLLAEGQTLAVDMLFAPASAMQFPPAPIWQEIVNNRHRLISRKTAKFVDYCEKQAKKYGIKGSRIHALRNILAWFDKQIDLLGSNTRLSLSAGDLFQFITEKELQHTEVVYIRQISGLLEPHLDCCDRKASFNIRLDAARAIYARMMDTYGARALMAENNQGVDWKALSHAVRIGHEAIELLASGWITFPRPEAEHLRAIKSGTLPYAVVAAEIEDLLAQVKAAQDTSHLSDEPEQEYIDSVICRVYGDAIGSSIFEKTNS
jgi:hypothetical protein